MNKVNKDLISYIEKNIFPKYDENDMGHQIEHIKYVIERSFKLSEDLNIDKNMVYTIASYHDCGHYIDKDNHEIISAKMMADDTNLQNFFSLEEINIIKEAIEDHRASLEYVPRSIYGKIISSADRNIDVNTTLKRTYLYGIKHYPNYTLEQHIQRAYEHIKEKFGKNGYAKMYIKDELYENFLNEIEVLLSNKNEFIKVFKDINTLNSF